MDKGMTHFRFSKGGSLHLSNAQIPGYVLVYTQGNTIRHNDLHDTRLSWPTSILEYSWDGIQI